VLDARVGLGGSFEREGRVDVRLDRARFIQAQELERLRA
jgi:hypothetical protein